jgi:hypothetical protein
LTWGIYSDALRDYLKSNPIINKLYLTGQQSTVVDLRDTGLTTLSINPLGLEEIWLNERLETLILHGPIQAALTVHDPHQGRFLELITRENSLLPSGLGRLRKLVVPKIKDFDLAPAVKAFPELRSLRITGKPGDVRNLSALSRLKRLREFWGSDIFGFAPGEFPLPEELPELESLTLQSIPADAGEAIKKAYKPLVKHGFYLSVKQLRKAEWLAANRNNPFRDWDGDEYIPPSCAKKAFDLYRQTRATLLVLGSETDVQQQCENICTEYIAAFNKMDRKHQFIDTIIREQVVEVLDKLLQETTEKHSDKIDIDRLWDSIEKIRDF